MNQSKAIDYLWEKRYFEEKHQSKEVSGEIWNLFKITCSNVAVLLKNKKYLLNKNGWIQRYGADTRNSDDTPIQKIKTIYIEAGKPVTALSKTGEILESLVGEILICDNYFGFKSMVNLYKLKESKNIKFICGNIKGDRKEIVKLIQDFNKEDHKLEVKIFDRAQLHDRYIITEKELIILGHGFADLGNKESLIIVIPKSFVRDICEELKNRFIQKWNGSKEI